MTLLATSGFPGGQKALPVTGPTVSALTITPITSPFTFDFGIVWASVATSAPQVFTVTNSVLVASSGPLITTLLGTNPVDFLFGTNNCIGVSLSPGATCTVSTSFAPIALGVRSAILNVAGATSPGPVFTLSGTGGTAPALAPSLTSINFTARSTGTTSPASTVTLTNNGGSPSGPIAATISGGNSTEFSYTLGTCAGAGIAPGASCTLNVFFGPVIAGAKATTLSFGNGTATVSLTGLGF